MNEEAYKVLQKILIKSLGELTQYDIAFLNARRSYLSGPELEKYEHLFPNHKQPKKTKEVRSDTDITSRPTYKQLQSQASKLGMPTIVGISREVLEAYIKNNSDKE